MFYDHWDSLSNSDLIVTDNRKVEDIVFSFSDLLCLTPEVGPK